MHSVENITSLQYLHCTGLMRSSPDGNVTGNTQNIYPWYGFAWSILALGLKITNLRLHLHLPSPRSWWVNSVFLPLNLWQITIFVTNQDSIIFSTCHGVNYRLLIEVFIEIWYAEATYWYMAIQQLTEQLISYWYPFPFHCQWLFFICCQKGRYN